MRIGHKQQSLFKTNWKHQFSHGGTLRNKRRGRGQRPLSTREPLHVVFKVNRLRLRHRSLRSAQGLSLILLIIRKYAAHFAVRIDQYSVQGDHLHLLLRAPRRSGFHHFFRLVAGQIAQRFELEGLLATDTPTGLKNGAKTPAGSGTSLWQYRPFSRVVRGYRAHKIVRAYIALNEKEILRVIPYQKRRLRGLSTSDWELLGS
jgi:putative transposase